MAIHLTVALLLIASSSLCMANSELTRRQKLRVVSIVDWNFHKTISHQRSKTTQLVGPKTRVNSLNGNLHEMRSTSNNKLKIRINRRCHNEAYHSSFNHTSGK